jgi:hypothetical protein
VLKDAPGKDIVVAIETVMSGGIYYSAALARQLAQPQDQDNQLTSREHEVLRHIATASQQADRARARPQRAHRGNPPPQHQAQARHRRAGRTDPLCRAKCTRWWQYLNDAF